MNLISFVTALILLLTISTHSLIFKSFLTQKKSISMQGNLHASRKVHNKFEKKLLASSPNTQIKKKEEPHEKKKTEAPAPYQEIGKLNIFPLLTQGKEAEPLRYELFAHLLRIVYQDKLFADTEKLEYILLDQMILSAQELSTSHPLCLEKLNLHDEKLQQIYYRLLKGTKMASFDKGLGIVPLLNLVTLHDNGKYTIHLPLASKEILCALLPQKEMVETILQKQQTEVEGFKPISRNEFEEILLTQKIRKEEFKYWPLLDFSKTLLTNHVITGFDKKTQISIKRKSTL